MLKAVTKIFDGKPVKLEARDGDRFIRSVVILNNSPFFLYVGRNPRPTREDALFVVEPYSDVAMPLSQPSELFVIEGPSVGTLPPGCQALIQYGPDPVELAIRKQSRNVVIKLIDTTTTGSGGAVLSAQGLGGTAGAADLGTSIAVPASSRRRTFMARTDGGTTFAYCGLEGSSDGGTLWYTLTQIAAAGGTVGVTDIPDSRALPPLLRVTYSLTDPAKATKVNIDLVVEL